MTALPSPLLPPNETRELRLVADYYVGRIDPKIFRARHPDYPALSANPLVLEPYLGAWFYVGKFGAVVYWNCPGPVQGAWGGIWQAEAFGRYNTEDAEGFVGFGRAATDDDGRYRFRTLTPGPTPGPGGRVQAPHIAFGISCRGLLKRLVTRLYFEGDAGNDFDPVLALVPETRRQTLMASAVAAASHTWRFDIVLQGEGETVFFDF